MKHKYEYLVEILDGVFDDRYLPDSVVYGMYKGWVEFINTTSTERLVELFGERYFMSISNSIRNVERSDPEWDSLYRATLHREVWGECKLICGYVDPGDEVEVW